MRRLKAGSCAWYGIPAHPKASLLRGANRAQACESKAAPIFRHPLIRCVSDSLPPSLAFVNRRRPNTTTQCSLFACLHPSPPLPPHSLSDPLTRCVSDSLPPSLAFVNKRRPMSTAQCVSFADPLSCSLARRRGTTSGCSSTACTASSSAEGCGTAAAMSPAPAPEVPAPDVSTPAPGPAPAPDAPVVDELAVVDDAPPRSCCCCRSRARAVANA